MNVNSTTFRRGTASASRCMAATLLLLACSLTAISASPYVLVDDAPVNEGIDWLNPVRAISQMQEMKFAQINHQSVQTTGETVSAAFVAMPCFVGFSAGDDASYCSGDAATLDGGYNSYIGAPTDNGGLRWSIVPGNGAGSFLQGGFNVGTQATNLQTGGTGPGNFSTVSNGGQGPLVEYVPGSGDELVELALETITMAGSGCVIQYDTVRLFFYPELTASFAEEANGMTVAGGTAEICSGETYDVAIDMPAGVFGDDPNGAIPHYRYTITDPSGQITGLPADGIGEAIEFDAAFNNLTLANTSGASATATINVSVFFDIDDDNMVGSNECEGPVSSTTVTVFPQAQATGSVNNGTNNFFCEDETAEFRITGSPNSTVTYQFDLDDGNGFGADQTIMLGASGTNGGINGEAANLITLPLAGLGGDSIRIRLTEVEYTSAPSCPRTLNFTRGIRVVDTPTGSLSLTDADDADFCNGDLTMGTISYTFTTTSGAGTYELAIEESVNGGASTSSSYSVTTAGGPSATGTIAIAYPTSAIAGQTVTYTLTGITESGSGLSCGGNVTGQMPITVIEQPDPEVTFDVTAAGTTVSVDNSTPGTLTVCDGTSVDFSNAAFPASLVVGDDPMVELTITGDTYDFFGGDRSLTLTELMNLDAILNIPNNVTSLQTITLTFTPYYESDAVTGITGDDCSGDNNVLTINIQPAIVATLSANPAASPAMNSVNDSVTVCTGEDVVFTIMSSADGSANVVVANGPNQVVSISGGVGTFTLSDLQNNTSFTLVDVTANGCTVELNETIDVIEEEVPTATITVNNGDLCSGGSDTLNLTAIGGEGPDFSYTIEGRDPNMNVIMFAQIDGSNAEIVELIGLSTPGTYSYYVTSVFNDNGAPPCGTTYTIGVDAPVVEVVVEEVAEIAVSSNTFSGDLASTIMVDNDSGTTSDTNNEICSGDDVELTFMDQSDAVSLATGDSLYYLLVLVQDETQTLASGFGIIATSTELGANPILDQAFVNTSATVEANVSFLAYGFYASSRPTVADALAGNGDICYGEELAFSFAVLPTPEADFGSNQTICYDSPAAIDFTGTPDAEVTVELLTGDAMVGTLRTVGADTIITLSASGSAFLTTGPMTEDLVLRITQVESADGCINTEILDVTVVVLPENDAEFTMAGPVDACQGTSAFLDITATADSRVYYTVGSRLDSIDVPASGMATLMTNPLASDSTFTIVAVGKTVTNQSGNPVTCVNAPTPANNLSIDVDVEVAPLGRITAVEPVCNDSEEPQLRFDTTGTFVGDDFTIVINGVTYNNVADGDIIFVSDSLMADTDYNLESIVNTTIGGNNCVDVVSGTISTTTVTVEAIPAATATVTLDGNVTAVVANPNLAVEFADTVCSGTVLDFALVGTPSAGSAAGDPLAYRVIINDPVNLLGFGAGMNDISLTTTQYASLIAPAFPVTLTNNSGVNPPPALLEVMIIPFYQSMLGNNQMAANSCPGDTIAFSGMVLGELDANFSSSDETICEDGSTTLTFSGTPNIRISFFNGSQVLFADTDVNGDATFNTGALTASTTYTITGFSTLPPAQQCTRTIFGGDSRTITVTPTPTLTVDMGASDLEICNDGTNASIALTSNSSNAQVTYTVGSTGSPQTFDLTGTSGNLLIGGLPQDTVVTFTMVTTDPNVSPVCPATISIPVNIIVRDLPDPVITNNGPACAGNLVGLTFTDNGDDALPTTTYNLIVVGPAGAVYTGMSTANNQFGPGRVFLGVSPGTVFTEVDLAGDYTIARIRDNGVNPTDGCVVNPTPSMLNTTTVVIDQDPMLNALVTGPAAVIGLSQNGISTFNSTICNDENISVDFQSMTDVSNSMNPLFGEFTNVSDPAGILSSYLPAENGTLSLADLDFSQSLVNTTGAAATVSFTVTPYYEDGMAAGRGIDECAGLPLSFNITVLPTITAEISSPVVSPMAEACDDEVVDFVITGTPNASVTFSTIALNNLSTTSPVQLDGTGMATVSGTVDRGAGNFATFDISEVTLVTTTSGGPVTCTEALNDQVDVTINALPTGFLIVDNPGPICAGEEVNIGFETSLGFGLYTLVINNETYTADVGGVGANPFLFRDEVVITLTPAADTTFNLTSITYVPTGCTSTGMPLDDLTVLVNDVPAGTVTATDMNGTVTTATTVAAGPAIVCTGDSLTLTAAFNMGIITPAGNANYVSVNFDGNGNYFGQAAGPTGTIAIPVGDFKDEFSARFQNLTNNVQTASLEITYYFETNFNDTLDMDECVGETVFLDIEIQPNPIATDVDLTICSNEAVDFDLSAAITNGVTGVSYTYTVDPSASGLVDTNRVAASPANIVIPAGVLANTTTMDQLIVFTVTPATGATLTTPGCTGNDFTFTLTVQPAPALTSTAQNTPFCSQEEIGIEFGTAGAGVGAVGYDIVAITPSVPYGPTFIADPGNAVAGAGQANDAIETDIFTNYTSGTQTVTYSVAPTAMNGCVGDTVDVVATIEPEPFVMNLRDTVCSGVRLNVDIIQDLVANQAGHPASIRITRSRLDGVQNFFVFDENDDQVDFPMNGSELSGQNNGQEVIQDSLINLTNGGIDLVYSIEVNNEQGCGRNAFTYTLRVVPEATATLDIVGSASFCSDESVTLNAGIMGGSAPNNIQYLYSVLSADAGVVLNLTPSGSSVNVAAGMGTAAGNATIAVTVSDAATGCTATATQLITVGVTPANNPIMGDDRPCTNTLATYTVDDRGNVVSFALSNPNAGLIVPNGIDTSFQIIFSSNAGSGPFVLTMTETSPDGCVNTSELIINLADELEADFFFQLNSNNNPLEVAFSDNSAGGVTGYSWDFGDGTTSSMENPTHVFPDNPNNPGQPFDYDVRLIVGGSCAPFLDTIIKTITINTVSVCDDVALTPGLNFITFNVQPIADSSVANIFGALPGLLQVTSINDGIPETFIPGNGAANTVGMSVRKGASYVVIVNQASTVTACGIPIDPNFRRPLTPGANYVGYMGLTATSADTYLQNLVNSGALIVAQTFGNGVAGGAQNYVPNGGANVNSLVTFNPGQGYLVIVNQPVGNYRGTAEATESFDFVYGTVIGADVNPSDPIEILNEAGEVIGNIVTDEFGAFHATAIFGSVARPDGTFVDGLESNERISFRYNGVVVSTDVAYRGDNGVNRIDLDFSGVSTSVETVEVVSSITVVPNPIQNEAVLTLLNLEQGSVSIQLLDVNGRVVRTLFQSDNVPSGDLTVTINDADNLSPGMYSVILTHNGRLVKEATRRVIKQ